MKNNLNPFCSLLALLVISFATSVHVQGQIITTFAGTGAAAWYGDGMAATVAKLNGPNGVLSDKAGNIYISDAVNNRVRMVNTAGIISEIAGNGTPGYMGDGGPASAAEINDPASIVLDQAGNLYFSEYKNHIIRKVDNTGKISTIAGTPGVIGYSGDGAAATAAKFNYPYGLALNSRGDLFICDQYNHCIRKIDGNTGIISTICGNGTMAYSGDAGPATAALIAYPNSIYTDLHDNIYFSDNGNHRIRMIDLAGTINTVAGGGVSTADGVPATSAQLAFPSGMSLDRVGNLYFSCNDNTVRKVSASGLIYRYAGTGTAGYGGDGGAATAALINNPNDVKLDPNGNIFIADVSNHRIREIPSGNHAPAFAGGALQTFKMCENTTKDMKSIEVVSDIDPSQSLTWTLLSPPGHGTAVVAYTAMSTGSTMTPTASLTYTPTAGYTGTDTFKVKVDDGISADVSTICVSVEAPAVISGISVIFLGAPVTLSTSSAGGTWSSSNAGVAIVGSSSGTVAGIVTGSATITYTSLAGCQSTYDVLIRREGRVNDPRHNADLTIAPNPGTGVFTVTGKVGMGSEQVTLNVTDMAGHSVYRSSVRTQNGAINEQVRLDNALPAGTYLLLVSSGSLQSVYHIVIDR